MDQLFDGPHGAKLRQIASLNSNKRLKTRCVPYNSENKGYLLGEEGLEGFEEATHSQAISQFDAAVHGSSGKAEQLADRVTQLFHTINHLTVFLIG